MGPGGEPAAVVERGAALRVVAVQERWRVEEEWWREPIARDYYRLLLGDGSVRTLYTDIFSGDWFAQNY